ncbi:hypothetical protein E3T39_01455 [Cryobacterium suzukii]|uniref:Uncharacterized protein n=1 Tax=Cryobacterium suzukii TaxID=1259198 RepID=A0A4R9AI05_9MICO|nr:hypothetical protein [Cryobacterium suzukii]TFD62640.1 hypothetical protein E3T39_01455 [Cryobacterium suzukii]
MANLLRNRLRWRSVAVILALIRLRLPACLPELLSLHRILDEGGSYQSQLAVAAVVFAAIIWAVSRLPAWT